MTTYDFYRDTYGGSLSDEVFSSNVGLAEAVISALLYPTVAGDLSDVEIYNRAVCAQIDHIAGRAGEEIIGRRVKSEAIGDRSVTYEDDRAGVFVLGTSVSPLSVMLLEGAGYLSRWI